MFGLMNPAPDKLIGFYHPPVGATSNGDLNTNQCVRKDHAALAQPQVSRFSPGELFQSSGRRE
jgi:hypothetical protein